MREMQLHEICELLVHDSGLPLAEVAVRHADLVHDHLIYSSESVWSLTFRGRPDLEYFKMHLLA